MQSEPLRLRLSWEDPTTGERREPLLTVPIALGREFARMPAQLEGRRVSRMVLNSLEVSRYHLLIDLEPNGLMVIDQNSGNGTFVNGMQQSRCLLANGDTLQVGPYTVTISFAGGMAASLPPPRSSQIFFNPDTGLPDPTQPPLPPTPAVQSLFPPPAFQDELVKIQDLHATGFPVAEVDYAAVGAGLGSFVWVDLLRLGGVKPSQIRALGLEPQPYARYKQLCENSQIPPYERLRSNSDSCPDNIWGWPSYAVREAWQELVKGKFAASLQLLWRVFAEPTFAETYTPRSGNVFASIDREVKRIGWESIFEYGRVRAIRKTEDGRYAIALSRRREGTETSNYAFCLARYIHLATGYPAVQFLPDLQAYREKTGDYQFVVNAYEPHNHIYEHLEQFGGTVMIRGRGIVASRVVQRIDQARKQNSQISILHLMRGPNPQGNRFGRAQRVTENHYEFQPFNWPKACWGGDLREMLEKATPQERQQLLADWGGTTTADRSDWRHIVQEGLNQGWYSIVFGNVERVEQEGKRPITYIQQNDFKGEFRLEADFIIDATGLDAKVEVNPLLQDLVTHYNLPLNALGRLSVSNDFELVEMRNQQGRMYAAGAATLGGPYAAVDSFLGLQYAALRSVDRLAQHRAIGLSRLNLLRSVVQWWKWAMNQAP